MLTKTCHTCKQSKLLNEFHKRSDSKDGLQGNCKECNIEKAKAWNNANIEVHRKRSASRGQRLSKHGLTEVEWDQHLDKIKQKCQICQKVTALVVDHDHDSGLVRGAICTHCNRGLGAFYDDPAIMRRAAAYVKNPPLKWWNRYSRVTKPSDLPHGWKEGRKPRSSKA